MEPSEETKSAISLSELLKTLDAISGRISVEVLTENLNNLTLGVPDVEKYMHFGTKTYRRNLLHKGVGYHALVLCWRPGQRSPIHDHTGSSCGVRIISGTAIETRFIRNEQGHIYALDSRKFEAGYVCANEDADIHQMSNLEATEDLVTLHIYSPQLHSMNTYSLGGTKVERFDDPVYGFSDGGGI